MAAVVLFIRTESTYATRITSARNCTTRKLPVMDSGKGVSWRAISFLRSTMHNLPATIPNNQLPEIAVGILSFNRAAETLQTIGILLESDYPDDQLQITVIDNASSDGTPQIIREQYGDRVQVIELPTNQGPVARNRLMLTSTAPFIFMFDDDSAPEHPGTLRGVVEFLTANPQFGALCFYCYNAFSGLLEFGDPAQVARHRLENGGFEAALVVGPGMCFRREAIQQTTGYDERLFWGGEEHGLALLLMYHTIATVLHPDYSVIHRRAPRVFTQQQVYRLVARNDMWNSFRHFPLPVALLVYELHIARWMVMSLLKGGIKNTAEVFRGMADGLKGIGPVLANRKVIPVRRLLQHWRWLLVTMNLRRVKYVVKKGQ